MHSLTMSIAIATLVLGLLVAPSPTGVAGKTSGRDCSAGCSYYDIRYPFGIGPECSLPGFNLSCVAGAHDDTSSNLLLGNQSIEVLDFGNSFPTVLTSIGYFAKLAPAQNYSVHWEAPGRPFAISGSSNLSLFVVGCGFKVSFTGDDSGVEVGNCSVACLGDETMSRLPGGLCIGIGCCRIDITVPVRAFTLSISRTGQSARLLEQVSAFITYNQNSYFGYSPYRFQPSNLEHDLLITGTAGYPVDLIWAIPYQPNCKRAMENRTSYACISNHSVCQEAPIDGYTCNCAEGSDGNPYVVDGCVLRDPDPPPPVYDSLQPKANCPTSCGNISFVFPFGTEVGCFAKLQLYLACDPGPSPPVLRLFDGSVVTDISIDEGTMRVLKSSDPNNSLGHMDSTLYVFSGEWGVLKWAVDSMTCKDAKASKKDYRCFSHSDCVDVTGEGDKSLKQFGYRCKCSPGFEGNPYLKDGCKDINECSQPDKYTCTGICQNTFGNYTCTACPHGTDFNDITRKCKPSAIILGVTIGLSSGGGILFLAVVVYILARRWKRSVQKRFRKRYFRKNKGILLEQLISSDESASDGTKIFSLEELEKATNNFDHTRIVGRGGHGTVYKGILSDQRVVAIKRSQIEASSEIEQFINEVSILSRINHRNVVKLHGCCLEAEVPLLAYEFISNGTLYDLLHHEQNGILFPLPWEERLRIAIEIAGALTYLHSAASVSILHRDVKSMNVLLNESYIAKVSDFGASRSIPIDQTHLVTVVQGTYGYLDPEYYRTGQLNEKSDVYSFGVILLELLTRKKPIFENENGEKQNLSNYFLWVIGERPLVEVVDKQIVCEESEEAIACMVQLAEECLSLTRGDRPTMRDVEMRLQMLRGRQSTAPPRCDGERISGLGGAVPVPVGHHGSRQYSLEQEFLSSSRVPR